MVLFILNTINGIGKQEPSKFTCAAPLGKGDMA